MDSGTFWPPQVISRRGQAGCSGSLPARSRLSALKRSGHGSQRQGLAVRTRLRRIGNPTAPATARP